MSLWYCLLTSSTELHCDLVLERARPRSFIYPNCIKQIDIDNVDSRGILLQTNTINCITCKSIQFNSQWTSLTFSHPCSYYVITCRGKKLLPAANCMASEPSTLIVSVAAAWRWRPFTNEAPQTTINHYKPAILSIFYTPAHLASPDLAAQNSPRENQPTERNRQQSRQAVLPSHNSSTAAAIPSTDTTSHIPPWPNATSRPSSPSSSRKA